MLARGMTNMSSSIRCFPIAVAFAGSILASPVCAQMHGYLIDSAGQPVRSGSGGCIKSGSWSTDKPAKGCDHVPDPARVILLPEPDGSVGKILVTTKAGEQLLEKAYAGAEVDAGRTTGIQESASGVQQRYGSVLGARPPRAVSYAVHFAKGSATELAPESIPVVEQMKAAMVARPVPEITVIGHTDRVGKVEANDALSLKRAETVRDILLRTGVKADGMEVVGRGEREPLVPTADEVAEPRNRRVEISVR